MSQNLFAVVLLSGEDKGAEILEEKYPEASFRMTPSTFIVVADSPLTKDLAHAIGLMPGGEEAGVRGAVFKLTSSYIGFAKSTIWEWLRKAESGAFG